MFAKKSISRIFSVLFVIGFILSVTPLQAVHAAGVRYAKPAASGTGDCLSWANACALQTALTGAASGDEIWVKAGTYKPTTGTDRSVTFQLKNGVSLYGGFAGTETARDQRNPTTNVAILSGDLNSDDVGFTNNSENVYHVVTGANNATLDGFTITAGNADDASASGGGMFNVSSSPTLTNVTFSGNSTMMYGGGMYNSASSPTMTNVTLSGNTAGLNGGGMYNWSSSNPTLTNITFSGNSAQYGGGMYNWSSSSPTLTNVTFNGNSATGYGGGMSNFSSSPTLTNVTFSDNTVDAYGGGMHNGNSSPMLTNVTFSGNSAMNNGGGMGNLDSSSPTLTNVTFIGNSADTGGGMYNRTSSSPTIRNTIFWGNKADTEGDQIFNAPEIIANPSFPIVSDSVVQGGCPAGSTCTHIITSDPLLGTLGNYGGFTQTIPLLAHSSAINTGNNATCAATDQRGITRPQGAHCDIGAFELVDNTLPNTSIDSQNPATTPTNSTSMTFTFSGTDTVSGVKSFECDLDGGGFAACASPKSYASLADGSHTFQVCAIDFVGNVDASPASHTWTLDTIAPTVVSSALADPDPTAAASVNFTVTFSEAVTGVDVSDFSLTTAGVSGASVIGISGSGSVYTVTINTGSDNGTIRLDVPISATIADLAGNPLASLPYTSGETYTITKVYILFLPLILR